MSLLDAIAEPISATVPQVGSPNPIPASFNAPKMTLPGAAASLTSPTIAMPQNPVSSPLSFISKPISSVVSSIPHASIPVPQSNPQVPFTMPSLASGTMDAAKATEGLKIAPSNVKVPVDWTDVANIIPTFIGQGVVSPFISALQSLGQVAQKGLKAAGVDNAITNTDIGGPINIPAFGKDKTIDGQVLPRGSFINSESSQSYYNDQIDSGVDPQTAYINTAFKTVGDMTALVPMLEGLSKAALLRVAPETLINPENLTVQKADMQDYLTGRKSALDLNLSQTVKNAINNVLETGTSQEKRQLFKGMDIQQVKPSALGTMLGVSQEQAESLLKNITGQEAGKPLTNARLPGYTEKPNPQAGGIDVPPIKTPVGFEPEEEITAPKGSAEEAPTPKTDVKVPETASDIVGDGSDLHAIETNTEKYVEANKDGLVSDYKAKFGNVYSVDNMKSLIPGHDQNPTLSEGFHKPAAKLIGKMVDDAIDKNAGTGKSVVMLAGSPAAGKTSAIESLSNHDEYLAHAGVVIDGTLADDNRSSNVIKQAIKTGQHVHIIYVENTPDRISNNLISRAQSGGRTVPVETTYNALQKSRQNIHRFAGKFGDTGKLKISVIDNSGEVPRIVDNGVGFIRNKVYSASDIQGFKEAAYHKAVTKYNEQEITKKVLDGLTRRRLQGSEGAKDGSRIAKFNGEESDTEVSKKEEAKPETASKASALDNKVAEIKAELQIAKEALDAHPAKGLVKYANFKTGELPEALGGDGKIGKFGKRGDQIVTELGFHDSEQARRSYEHYLGQKAKYVVLDQQYKGLRDLQKDEKLHQDAIDSANRFLEKSSGAMGKSVEVAAKARLKERLQQMAGEAQKRKQAAHANLRALEQVLSREAPALDQETLSIESQALQAANIEYSQLPSLPKMVIDTSTSVKQKVGILDYFRTPDRVLQKIGLGKNAQEIRTAYENYLSELPQHIELLREWIDRVLKYPGSDTKIFQYLDGELKKSWDPVKKEMVYDMKPEEYLVAQEIKSYLEDWAYRLGLPEDNQVTHYITHIFEDQIIKKEFDEDLAKIIENKVPGSVYDPFLQKRLGMKGYVQSTRRALEAYIKRAVRKANMDPALEHLKNAVGGDLKNVEGSRLESSQFKYVKRYADQVNLRPTEVENLIDNTTKQLLGYRFGQRPVLRAMKAMRTAVSRGMLGLNFGSAIRNLTQGVNTYAKLGEKYTAIGYTKLLTNIGSKELEDSGVLKEDLIQDKSLSASKRALQKLDKGLYIFFEAAEKINRGAAYWGAKSKAIDKGMSEEDAIQYAKKMVRDTQFSFGTIDTPQVLRGEIMKTILQFGSYSLKQTEFVAEMLNKREWSGLLRYIIASTLIVYTVGKAFNIKADNFIPGSFFMKFGTPPSLQLPLTIIKALLDSPDQYGKPRSGAQKLKDIGSAAVPFIPAGVQGQKTIQGIQAFRASGATNSPITAARAAAMGKSGVPATQTGNSILKKYGIGKNTTGASSILKKYGIK